MLLSLSNRTYTRRVATSLTHPSPFSTAHLPSTTKNEGLLKLLREHKQKEDESPTRNRYKVRSFTLAIDAIKELDYHVQHVDQLKGMKRIGRGIMNRVRACLDNDRGQEEAIATLMTVPGLGLRTAEALYADGCDTIEKLHLERYKETLPPKVLRGLKYKKFSHRPVPRENVERLEDFCKKFTEMGGHETIIVGESRRSASALPEKIDFLVIDKSWDDPIPTPPHPSTLKPPGSVRPSRTKHPFIQDYVSRREEHKSALLSGIIRPLKTLGVVSDKVSTGLNFWRGWVRVPKMGESWEPKEERHCGVQTLDGDFHEATIAYVPEKSRGAALLALTGDSIFYFDLKRKAVQAGLYLNEWGLWEWEPEPESLSRFQTSDAPHTKTSLGAIWGSETEEDKGRWVQLDSVEEERIFEQIGAEYVPPEKRNLRFIAGNEKPGSGGSL